MIAMKSDCRLIANAKRPSIYRPLDVASLDSKICGWALSYNMNIYTDVIGLSEVRQKE